MHVFTLFLHFLIHLSPQLPAHTCRFFSSPPLFSSLQFFFPGCLSLHLTPLFVNADKEKSESEQSVFFFFLTLTIRPVQLLWKHILLSITWQYLPNDLCDHSATTLQQYWFPGEEKRATWQMCGKRNLQSIEAAFTHPHRQLIVCFLQLYINSSCSKSFCHFLLYG